jgi:hypothetical protein
VVWPCSGSLVGSFGVGSFRDLVTRLVDGWAGLVFAALFGGIAGTSCTVGRLFELAHK